MKLNKRSIGCDVRSDVARHIEAAARDRVLAGSIASGQYTMILQLSSIRIVPPTRAPHSRGGDVFRGRILGGGLGVRTPRKYVGGVRVCFDPHSFIKNCCCITASFTAPRMNSWTFITSLSWSCLCWSCYDPYVWSAPCRLSSNECLCCSTGLSYRSPRQKQKLQNVGAGDSSSTILIDHGSHAVLPTIDRLQLG